METIDLEKYVDSFEKLALEKVPTGLWERLYNPIIGLMSTHLLGRLCFRLFVRVSELETRVAELERSNKRESVLSAR